MFFDCLRKLDPQPDRYVFTENNSTDDTLVELWNFELPREIHRLWFVKDATNRPNYYTPMAHVMQVLLIRARQLNPDYAIISACDVFVRSTDCIDILTTWGVDCVAARIVRRFGYPESDYFISAKRLSELYPKGDVVTVYMRKKMTKVFDDTYDMVGFGLVCLSRKVIQDRRINFYPLSTGPLGKLASEDFGYCLQMRRLGYKCCLDGIVVADHVVWDKKNRVKAWTQGQNFEYPNGQPQNLKRAKDNNNRNLKL